MSNPRKVPEFVDVFFASFVVWVIIAGIILGVAAHDAKWARYARIHDACIKDGRPAYECEAMALAATRR